jgi:hypothetical protein
MPLFGRKKEEIEPKIETIPILTISTPEQEKDISLPPKPVENVEKPEKRIEKEPERPMFAPLFVKLDRYRQILNSIAYLKNTIVMMKNSMMTLSELDRARNETMGIIQKTLDKIEKKMNDLDSELVRPAGYNSGYGEVEKQEYNEVETVGITIADLKSQIEQLKSEVASIG